jgi:hypothetical protein
MATQLERVLRGRARELSRWHRDAAEQLADWADQDGTVTDEDGYELVELVYGAKYELRRAVDEVASRLDDLTMAGTIGAGRHGLTTNRLLSMSDEELVRRAYAWAGRVEDDTTADALYFLLTEAFERFAPHAESAESERRCHELYAEPDRSRMLREHRENMRSREGARMLKRELGEDQSPHATAR